MDPDTTPLTPISDPEAVAGVPVPGQRTERAVSAIIATEKALNATAERERYPLPIESQARINDAWKRWIDRITRAGRKITALKHYRINAYGDFFLDDEQHRYHHIAVVVEENGDCFIGVACLSEEDQYCKRIGRTMAIGRAVKAAAIHRPLFRIRDVDFGKNIDVHRAVWIELVQKRLNERSVYNSWTLDPPHAIVLQGSQCLEIEAGQ